MKADGLLSILTFSEKRKGILFLLQESPRTLSEIKNYFEVESSEILPRLKEMENSNLIIKKDRVYHLTRVGQTLAKSYNPFLDAIKAIENNVEFWRNHDISAIPEDLFEKVGKLKNCKVVKVDEYKIVASHTEFIKHAKTSKCLKGATYVFNPQWVDWFTSPSHSKSNIEIIVTPVIYEEIKREYADKLEDLLINPNAHMYICDDDIKVAFAIMDSVGDPFFSFSLDNINNHQYDTKNDLEGFDYEALEWGSDLFEFYKARSIEVPRMQPANEYVYIKGECDAVKRECIQI